jgi:hypothetical protein
MAAGQLGLAAVGALGVGVVDPTQDNQPRAGVKPEEQSVLLKELVSSPVAMRSAERGSLLVLLATGVLGDVLEHQAGDGRQALA